MRQVQTTQGVVLARTNFGEADRIVTLLTPDHGKLRLMAKGARRVKSKLAGGIELFSISDISFMAGKGDIGTLVSTHLQKHFQKIVDDLSRTMLGYELLKRLDRATEDGAELEYFELLTATLGALNDGLDTGLLELWFDAQLLKLAGHQPNLRTDTSGAALAAGQRYNFDTEAMALTPAERGSFQTSNIKLLRLVFDLSQPDGLARITDVGQAVPTCRGVVTAMRQQFIR